MGILSGGPGRSEGSGAMSTMVGAEASFQGTLNVGGSVTVLGTVDGDVINAANVLVGKGGAVNGDIFGKEVVVVGTVTGNVTATEKLELKGPAGRITGNIRARTLIIEEGARFEGNCSMDLSEEELAALGRGEASKASA